MLYFFSFPFARPTAELCITCKEDQEKIETGSKVATIRPTIIHPLKMSKDDEMEKKEKFAEGLLQA